ncbi:SH3 domain-containing protein [Leptospira alstonii]|uniref:SH3 domain-containing protein n=1 Tax=Leptospira alstonii TaxID=28452 RepID=UPI00138F7713|nr:SH3 domain-containing protein [Leptospira alstonii]
MFLVIFFSYNIANAESKNSNNSIGVIIVRYGISLYSAPSASSTTLKIIYPGKIIKILEEKLPVISIGRVKGNWIKVQYNGLTGWIFANSDLLSKMNWKEQKLYIGKLNGIDVFEVPFDNSKVITHLKLGEEVKTLSTYFNNNSDYKNWITVQIGNKIGFVFEDYFTVEKYSKEEIENAPFLGMNFIGSIENCKSGLASILENSGTPEGEGRVFYISNYKCRGKEYAIFEESNELIPNFSNFTIKFILEKEIFPNHLEGFYVTSHTRIDREISCYTKDSIQIPIVLLKLKKSKQNYDENKNVTYRNIIEKAWIYDSKLNTLVEKEISDGFCFSPNY